MKAFKYELMIGDGVKTVVTVPSALKNNFFKDNH
jgi:hypothetical protein